MLFGPNYLQIFKQKGSRFDLEMDRGIFILPVLKKVFDKLIYEEKYPFVDGNISDSNIGARRGKNIKKSFIHSIWNYQLGSS